MKDNIDSILDSMFSNGRLSIGSAGQKNNKEDTVNKEALKENSNDSNEEYQKLLEDVKGINQKLQSSIQQDIELLTQETTKQIEGLNQQIIQDENSMKQPRKLADNANSASLKKDIASIFTTAETEIKKNVIGQDSFVKELGNAFKRPFAVGIKNNMPSSRTLITGSRGTGRHMALEAYVISLHSSGLFNSSAVNYINLSKYKTNTSEKTFIQDLYSAASGKASAISFENFDQCHSSVLKLVSDLFVNGIIHLDGRYVEQKGILTEIGTALVKNAVSTVTAEGKYLFFVTDKKENKLMDSFGAKFISSFDDICKTEKFSNDSLKKIASKLLENFCVNMKKNLSCDLSFKDESANVLSGKYIPDLGIHSLSDYLSKLTKSLENYKLEHPGAEVGLIEKENGGLSIRFKDSKVTIARDAGGEELTQKIKDELAGIVGLSSVKEYIYALEDNFRIQQMRRERGMKVDAPSMHMIFTGNPGTGKTTIARIISRYLKSIGILPGGQLIEVTRADLVGKYVGHTAPLTQNAIQSALGGVLFIDEAYSLYRGKDDSFGLEAIDTLVKGMEDHREDLVVILAGYTCEMQEFLESNSGLKSRFPNQIEFPDYTAQELVDITKSIVADKGYILDEECIPALYVHYDIMQTTGDPRTNGNGRMARNIVESAIINASKRNLIEDNGEINLELLKLEDFNL